MGRGGYSPGTERVTSMYQGHYPRLGHAAGLGRPPPLTVADDEERTIRIREFGAGSPESADYEALVELFREYEPALRSLGIPPATESRIRDWLDIVLSDVAVLACHEGRPIGLAVLVADAPGTAELAIFIHQDYLGAGIGTDLLEATLALGRRRGFEEVWLLAEGSNRRAINLYTDLGFAVVDAAGGDLQMAVSL